MLMLISPAKTLDFESSMPVVPTAPPMFLDASTRLVEALRQQSAGDLAALMKISPALAALNARRFADWHTPFTLENARPAVFAFRGDVYQGLDADTLGKRDLEWAQRHLRILSGLYGLLRPLDLIQPYRLEMGTRLAFDGFRNLYQFWGDRITQALNHELTQAPQPLVVNLASQEYFAALQPAAIDARVITPTFQESQNGRYRFLAVFGKRARGLMARYVIEHRIVAAEDLQAFDADGYRFVPERSTAEQWVFARAARADRGRQREGAARREALDAAG
jgi:cytoplasmic iron level regulating protein YaaA (DUF328/UPF0246 family)